MDDVCLIVIPVKFVSFIQKDRNTTGAQSVYVIKTAGRDEMWL